MEDYNSSIYIPKTFNGIQIIQNMHNLSFPSLAMTVLMQTNSALRNFYSEIFSRQFKSLDDITNSFKQALPSILLMEFVSAWSTDKLEEKLLATHIKTFLDLLIDELILDLGDNCLLQQTSISCKSQTAVNKFGFEGSPSKLTALVAEQFLTTHKNEAWNFFLASNSSVLKKDCSLSYHGGPAIVSTLTLMESKCAFPYDDKIDFSALIKLIPFYHITLIQLSSTWKQNFSKFSYPVAELSYYHLEKLWKIDHIESLISSLQHKIIKPAILNNLDLEFLFDFLEGLEQESPYPMVNLFLMEYILQLRLESNVLLLAPYKFWVTFFIPFIRNAFYYCIIKACIQENVLGKDLYPKIFAYIAPCFKRILKKHYAIPDDITKTLTFSQTTKDYFFPKVVDAVYKIKPSPFQKTMAKELQREIQQSNDKLNHVTYYPGMFDDILLLNKLIPGS